MKKMIIINTILPLIFGAIIGFIVFMLTKDQEKSTIGQWTDPETKCEYFIPNNGGITPRLGTDGFPLCQNTILVDE